MHPSNRESGRKNDQLRPITITPNYIKHAEGSCLISYGDTQVICTASIDDKIPPFLRNSGQGWVTAEYGMLPRSTGTRMDREASKGRQSGRTQEIQRLIGRSLRSVVDLKKLGELQIKIDCDVIQADGGTRTASITGGYIALYLALKSAQANHKLKNWPILEEVAAISCGIYKGMPILDLDYSEDSNAESDANFVMTRSGGLVEVQATAEKLSFSKDHFAEMMALAEQGIQELTQIQRQVLGIAA